jgi:DNA-binding transcriptional regulator YiaG
MTSLADALKSEISRIARKEARRELAALKKASTQYRRRIAELNAQNLDLTRRLAFLETQERKRLAEEPPAEEAETVKFSPKYVAAHRKKLGLSAADYGKLAGVSAITIYNWESGKSRPRDQQLASWASIRHIGKREAKKRMELLGL